MCAGEPGIAGDGRPAGSEEGEAGIVELADGLARARVDHPHRGVDEIAVLGVLGMWLMHSTMGGMMGGGMMGGGLIGLLILGALVVLVVVLARRRA